MANRYTAVVGSEFTLDASFTLNGDAADVYEVLRVEIQNEDEEVLVTIDGDDVVRPTEEDEEITGLYRVTVPALTQGGHLFDVWYYTPVEDADDTLMVLQVDVATFVVAGGETEAEAEPSLESSSVCVLTATFRDASGEPVQGVLVRFSPVTETNANTAFGFASKPVTAQSDEDGLLELRLIRGLQGVLSISGINLVRQVTIPDSTTVDIFALASDAADPFAVQNLDSFTVLPRSS